MTDTLNVTVLGAGAMGTALAVPLAAGGHDVRLWGTWLDGAWLAELRAGHAHPSLGTGVPERVRLFSDGELEPALDGADLVVLAVASQGVVPVLRAAAAFLQPGQPLVLTTKGFARDAHGRVALLPPVLTAELPEPLRDACQLVAVGGPCKANEVAAGQPTAAVFAAAEPAALTRARQAFTTDTYRIQPSADVAGVELAAACKNVFAIALGACDGLHQATGTPWHDLKAAAFTQAAAELAALVAAAGGEVATATGLAGVGDLQVTGLSGRNRAYGERLGRGQDPAEALAEMQAAGQTVEGVPACGLALELAGDLAAAGRLDSGGYPLLRAVGTLLGAAGEDAVRREAGAVGGLLAEACLPPRPSW